MRLALLLLLTLPQFAGALAAGLPSAFLGSWVNRDGAAADDREITGINVGRRTYHEPGYDCEIRSIRARNEANAIGRGRVYLVEMSCAGEEDAPGRPVRVKEVWALRRSNGKDILVMSGASGPTFPSVHVLERE
jgi:hypothetical protein